MRKHIFTAPITVLLILSTVLVVIGFVYTSRQVGVLNAQLQDIQSAIVENQLQANTLDAEWAYLTNPERIERLSKVLLPQEQSITAQNMQSLNDIRPADNFEIVPVGGNVSLQIYTTQ